MSSAAPTWPLATHLPRSGGPCKMRTKPTKLRLVAVGVCAVSMALARVEAVHTAAFSSETYRRLERVDPETIVPLAITLKPNDFRALEEKLYSVSDPRNFNYGHHLTREEADALARPDERVLTALQEWVKPVAGEDTRFSETTNTLKTSMPARQLEELLKTQLHHYELTANAADESRKRRLVRASTGLAIPDHLADAIAFISVNTHPLHLRALAASAPLAPVAPSVPSAIGGGTLERIRKLYGIPDDLVVTNASNSQTIPSFYHESWSPDDLTDFFKEYLAGESMPRIIEKGDRKNIPDRASIEASLDVQYITGVARNTTTYVWTMNGSNPFSVQDEPFAEFAEAVLALEKPPLVVSISYSDDEEHIFHVSADYARSFDTLLIKMGLRGITVLIASGDDGVAGLRPEFEKIPTAEACNKHGPQWPSSSPYITSVGATMILNDRTPEESFFKTNEEVVCSGAVGGMITSGGGFSSIYGIPEYQRRAVDRYLKSKRIPTRADFFNASGRGYPDISALGAGYNVHLKGHTTSVSGTSASTPVLGAMVTLWNDLRLNAGKSPLGFINPLIYYLAEHEPTAFFDVVVGNNGASKGNSRTCDDSFGATAGWDAVTGVGTPNFAVISSFIRGLEDKFNLTNVATPTPTASPACDLKANAPSNSTAAQSLSKSSDLPPIGAAVLAVSALVAAVLVVVLGIRGYKHWRRTQYSSLTSETNGTRDERSNSTPPGSPAHSPRGSMIGQDDEDFELPGKLEAGGVEMSEISLHD